MTVILLSYIISYSFFSALYIMHVGAISFSDAHFGEGNGSLAERRSWGCGGSEATLLQCNNIYGYHYYRRCTSHSQDGGVRCAGCRIIYTLTFEVIVCVQYNNYVYFQNVAAVVEKWDLLEEQKKVKEEWRSVLEELGGPSMIHIGDHQMPLWSAGSWGTMLKVLSFNTDHLCL